MPGGDTLSRQVGSMRIPPSELTLSSNAPSSTAPGHTFSAAIANVGGVDATVDYDLRVVDVRGTTVVSATASGAPIWAGESLAVPLTLPEQLASGDYTLRGEATNEATGAQEKLFHLFEVSGLDTSLSVATDRPSYLTTDPMTFTADLANGMWPLNDGTLTWRVTQPAGSYRLVDPEFATYTTANTGLTSEEVNDVVVDSEGNVWFATEPYWSGEEYVGGGVSVLSGTQWITYTAANAGLPNDHVTSIAAAPNGDLWFAHDEYDTSISVLRAGGSWITYTTANSGLSSENVADVAADRQGNVWFTHWEGGVSVRLTSGDWITYTAANSGLASDAVWPIAVDPAGNVWFGHRGEGASVLLPDGSWRHYDTEDGLGSNYIEAITVAPNGDVWFGHGESWIAVSVFRAGGFWETFDAEEVGFYEADAIAVDAAGNVWFGHYDGVSVLLPGGSWRHYDTDDGLGSNNVQAISIAPDGTRWLACDSEEGQPGSATAIHGPLAILSPWQPYTEPFLEGNPYGNFEGVLAAAADPAGNRWFVSVSSGEGYFAYLHRLSADGDDWQTFSVPGSNWDRLSDLAVDGTGTAWLATRSSYEGVQARDVHGNWEEYTVESTGGELVSNDVQAIDVDAQDRVWFATRPTWEHSGGVSVLSGTQWITYTTANSGLSSENIADVAADRQGNVWFTHWEGGVSVRLTSGDWITYTAANSPLPSDNVTAITVDDEDNTWIATIHWDHEAEELSCNLSLHRPDGTWAVYSSSLIPPTSDIAVQRDGTVWLMSEDRDARGLVSFSPATGKFVTHTVDSTYGGLVTDAVMDLMVDRVGDLWVACATDWDEDDEQIDGGVSRYTGLTRVLWQSTLPIDLSGGERRTEQATLMASELGATGRLHLEGELETTGGQTLALDRVPFTVYDAHSPSLSLAVTPKVAPAGAPITLTGTLRNGNPLTLTNQVVTLALGGETVALAGPRDVPPGGVWPFSAVATAPAEEGYVWAEATDGAHSARDRLTVDVPTLDIALEAPDAVGREPFDLVVDLENPTLLDAAVELGIETSDTQHATRDTDLAIPAGQARTLIEPYAIAHDTIFTVTVVGEPAGGAGTTITRTLIHQVAFGEDVAATFSPDPVYPEGAIAIPYTLTNTGQLPIRFTTAITVQSPISNLQSSFSTYLPTGESAADRLLLDLPTGAYTLTHATPFGGGAETFRVAPAEAAELSAVASPRQGSAITVTAAVTNTGFRPISGSLRLETPFFQSALPLSLSPSLPLSYSLPLETTAAEPGAYTATLALLNGGGHTLVTSTLPISVPGADLALTAAPTETVVRGGEPVTLSFDVENRGSAPAMAVITATVGDLVDEAQGVWLPGGAGETLDFVFRAPEGLSGDALAGVYWFEGQRYDLTLPVAGVDLDAEAGWDQAIYAPGVTATLQLTVTNRAAGATPPLYAHVAYHDQVITRPLTLNGGESVALDLPLRAETGREKVFYAIYEEQEQRGVHLNTTYLYVRNPGATIVPDATVYEPGDTVESTVYADLTGTLTVTAPGLSTTLDLTGDETSFQFDLPDDLKRGTYAIDYALAGWFSQSAPFDVDAPWVRVTEARLRGQPYAPGDALQADLTIASTDPLDVETRAWLVAPDGTHGAQHGVIASLQPTPNNPVTLTLPLSTSHAGSHRLVYQLVDPADPERIYAVGSERFDVGTATILGLRTDRETYPYATDPITASLTLHARKATSATLDLLMDDARVVSHSLALTRGVRTLAVPVPGPVSSAHHDLTARVAADGLSHAAHTSFAYGTDVADLVTAAPRLAGGDGLTRTLRTRVYNRGGTASLTATLQIWDGDPETGGTSIGAATIPPLLPGASERVELAWDVLGQGGPHTLYAVVDPADEVVEFHEENNTTSAEVALPRFDLRVETAQETYPVGEPVVVTVHAVNLMGAESESLTITTTARYAGQLEAFQDVQSLHLLPTGEESLRVAWETAGLLGGSYAIQVQGVDQDGERTRALTTVQLEGRPQVEIGPGVSGDEGTPITFTAVITDPDTPTGHLVAWNFGDGSTSLASGTLTSTHIYTDDGTYAVTLAVTDTTGLGGTDGLSVTVENAVPEVEAGPDQSVDEGEEVTFDGAFSDPGALDTHTVEWDFGDEITATGTLNPTHAYADAGVYTVTLTVTDDDGGAGSDSLVVTVEGAPIPTPTPTPEPCAVEQTLGEHSAGTESYRALRDDVFVGSVAGQRYIRLYEEHTGEVTQLLMRDPGLASQTAGLLRQWRPAVEALVAMERGGAGIATGAAQRTVTAEEAARAESVLSTLAERGSPALRADLEPVLARMDEFAGHTPAEIWAMLEEESERHEIYLPLVLSNRGGFLSGGVEGYDG
jgi:ligand-binding sensor domain-containing protein/PKD repeat protein